MTTSMTAVGMGNQRYFDVYLDDPSSSEDDEYIDLSRPLMSPKKFARRLPARPTPVKTNTPDTKLPKRKPVWYYKRKKDCLQAFYVVMIILVIIIFALVLLRILNDAAKHRDPDEKDENKLTAIAALGNFAMGGPFGINVIKPTEKPDLSSKGKETPKATQNPASVASQGKQSKADTTKPKEVPQEPQSTVLPCSKYTVQDVWVQNIPQLQIESGIRLLDVNRDSVLDAVIGFSTDANAYFGDENLMCSIYFNGSIPCFGGVLALDGITGQELWRHYTSMEVFAVTCNGDLTGDRINDCAVAGRAGVMEAVDGASGRMLWKYTLQSADDSLSNFYTAQFIHDIDNDGVRDLLNIMGGDPVRKPGGEIKHSGHLMLLSGSDGHAITMCEVPDGMESYYSPQIYYQHGGQAMVLFGTGGETAGGSLWVLPLDDVIICNMTQAKAIYTDPYKGVMTPPVLVDLTNDGVMDIVMSMFNSTVIAFNGQSYGQLWNYTFPSSESYSTPAAAFYNDDDIPDFMVIYNYGPGYPLYYYTQVTILDGRNGQPLLQKTIISSGTTTTSPLTVSTEGYGNDAYFYWRLGCEGHEQETESFEFSNVDDEGKNSLSRTNFCRERFNTGTVSTATLLNQHTSVPGQMVYTSADRFADEHRYELNATILAMNYLKKYPEAASIVINAQKAKDQPSDKATALPNKKDWESKYTTPASKTLTDSLDFQSEYDKLMARLSALSDNLEGEGDSPANEDVQVPNLNDNSNDANLDVRPESSQLDMGKEDYRGKSMKSAPSPPEATTSSTDALLTGDITEKLHDLGLPEEWLDSTMGDKLQKKTGGEDLTDELDGLSQQEIEDMLMDLLGLDGKDDKGETERHRLRRHAGLHDAGGIQRLISTGTLAPPLSPVLDDLPSNPNSIDVIFATYWFYPKPNRIITAKEQKCIDDWMGRERQRMDPSNEYYGLDHDAYEHLGSEHCRKLAASVPAPPTKAPTNPLNMYPFNLDAGEMTVYRLRLSCDCDLKKAQKTNPGARCTKILPYHQQEWGAYMGTYGNSYFRRRMKEGGDE